MPDDWNLQNETTFFSVEKLSLQEKKQQNICNVKVFLKNCMPAALASRFTRLTRKKYVTHENRKWVSQIKTKHHKFCFLKKKRILSWWQQMEKYIREINLLLSRARSLTFLWHGWDHVLFAQPRNVKPVFKSCFQRNNELCPVMSSYVKFIVLIGCFWLLEALANHISPKRGQWGAVTRRTTRKRKAVFIYQYSWSATVIAGGFHLTF